MRVLIACEESATVREQFRLRGHDAWSCDILPSRIPGNHIQGDVLKILRDGWDLMIAHPPCTYLTSSGLHWNRKDPTRAKKTEAALRFVRRLLDAPIPRIGLENPSGCIGTRIRPADQYIQPHDFGDDASKRTGLWLKNLPKLQPTKFFPPRYVCECGTVFVYDLGKYGCPSQCGGVAKPRWSNQTDSGQNRLGPSEDRAKIRSVTYPGIAAAIAEQWGNL